MFDAVIAVLVLGGHPAHAEQDLRAASLALLLPNLAVAARRLHDTDRSGWWLLLSLIPIIGTLVLLYFLVLRGTEGSNRFG